MTLPVSGPTPSVVENGRRNKSKRYPWRIHAHAQQVTRSSVSSASFDGPSRLRVDPVVVVQRHNDTIRSVFVRQAYPRRLVRGLRPRCSTCSTVTVRITESQRPWARTKFFHRRSSDNNLWLDGGRGLKFAILATVLLAFVGTTVGPIPHNCPAVGPLGITE